MYNTCKDRQWGKRSEHLRASVMTMWIITIWKLPMAYDKKLQNFCEWRKPNWIKKSSDDGKFLTNHCKIRSRIYFVKRRKSCSKPVNQFLFSFYFQVRIELKKIADKTVRNRMFQYLFSIKQPEIQIFKKMIVILDLSHDTDWRYQIFDKGISFN
jgi:hypothetical protein